MLQVKCLASMLGATLFMVRLDVPPLRSHQKTPLDCWREVDAFKSAVATEEQVRFRCFFLVHAAVNTALNHFLQKYVSSLRQ